MIRKILPAVFLVIILGCSQQSKFPPPSQSERFQTVPVRSEEVKEAEKNVIAVTLIFHIGRSSPLNFLSIISSPRLELGGTGFMIRPGIVVTARHILMEGILGLAQRGLPFEVDASGLPKSKDGSYGYSFKGTTNVDGHSQDFELLPIAIGKLGEHKDFMALKAINYPKNLKPLKLAELKEKDLVYISGYIPVFSAYPDSIGREAMVLSDVLKESLEGQVYEVIKNMPINKVGVDTYYRIFGDAEPGFSGGPIINKNGEVGAMTLEVIKRFVYAISVKDIDDFINALEKRGLIK